MPITCILFDLGGVVFDSPLHAFAEYEAERGMPPGTLARINSTNLHTNAWARFERGELDADGFAPVFESEARALGAEVDAREVLGLLAVAPRPVMLSAIERLRGAGLRLAALTNNVMPLPREGEVGEALELFDVVIESSVERVRKPEPEFYELALARLGAPGPAVPPAGCVFLDDLGANLKTAREMGMTTIKVVSPEEALDRLAEVVGMALR